MPEPDEAPLLIAGPALLPPDGHPGVVLRTLHDNVIIDADDAAKLGAHILQSAETARIKAAVAAYLARTGMKPDEVESVLHGIIETAHGA